jgi:flagellar basal body rod protein FlgB
MFQTLFNTGAIPIAEKVLYFTRERHTFLANNVANAETPMYKAVDAPVREFHEALEAAIRERDRYWVPVFEFGGAAGVRVRRGGGLSVEPREVKDLSRRNPDRMWEMLPGLRRDLNNVDLDVEFTKMVKNAQLHNTMASVLAHQFGVLQEAIRERVG